MNGYRRRLVWLHGQVKTPPFSTPARHEAGFWLRLLQQGVRVRLRMPHSRPMTMIGSRCHELRIVDISVTWRIIYRTDEDEILIVEVFSKKSRAIPRDVIETCQRRLREYDDAP